MRTSPRTTSVEARVERGFRFEVLRYSPATGFLPEPVDLRILPGPARRSAPSASSSARATYWG
ncbi:hypothetical protein [Streptomyces sp. NBC_01285]|uniref:hypothetical protein n=1 Tax=Streptomyces sp. NBC_01285 TaxID=2903813 RepID=UPI00224DE381|nr:hypothetical protein [Streptomyces sp. NBC_01285]MCX4770608.1 hypothetical protein [Streptomyces sp. NBC_01285]